MSGGKS